MKSFYGLAATHQRAAQASAGPHVTFPSSECERGGTNGAPRRCWRRRRWKRAIARGGTSFRCCAASISRSVPASLSPIIGQSGSGKSTLLHLLGTLDAPDAGEIHFERPPHRQSCRLRLAMYLRNQYFGMIFQFYHLLPELTTLENVLMPLMIAGRPVAILDNRRNTSQRAEHLLEWSDSHIGLRHKPRELSGGEMQRAAIARALIAEPARAAGRRADRQPRSARPARKSCRFCEP